MANIDIQIETEIQSLNMLARKYSKESEIASYVYGMTEKMIKDIDRQKKGY